jgi:hypothetical protein
VAALDRLGVSRSRRGPSIVISWSLEVVRACWGSGAQKYPDGGRHEKADDGLDCWCQKQQMLTLLESSRLRLVSN